MECNKDEAVRAKGIAEKKMKTNDFIGARSLALKAQQLYPGLDNILQILAVCDVHCSADKKVSYTQMDWYSILQVESRADMASIRKQYLTLCRLLHPDKNNFAGANDAFKLITAAHDVLSDQTKRSLYDDEANKQRSTHPPLWRNSTHPVQEPPQRGNSIHPFSEHDVVGRLFVG